MWFGIDVNGRGAVVRLSDGSLWVHSPVNLDPELKAAVDALGAVKHIVTPNFEHNKFAAQVCFVALHPFQPAPLSAGAQCLGTC